MGATPYLLNKFTDENDGKISPHEYNSLYGIKVPVEIPQIATKQEACCSTPLPPPLLHHSWTQWRKHAQH